MSCIIENDTQVRDIIKINAFYFTTTGMEAVEEGKIVYDDLLMIIHVNISK